MAHSNRSKPFFRFMVICAIVFGANNSFEMNVAAESNYPSLDGWYIDNLVDDTIFLFNPNRIKKHKGIIIYESLLVSFKENTIWSISHEINCYTKLWRIIRNDTYGLNEEKHLGTISFDKGWRKIPKDSIFEKKICNLLHKNEKAFMEQLLLNHDFFYKKALEIGFPLEYCKNISKLIEVVPELKYPLIRDSFLFSATTDGFGLINLDNVNIDGNHVIFDTEYILLKGEFSNRLAQYKNQLDCQTGAWRQLVGAKLYNYESGQYEETHKYGPSDWVKCQNDPEVSEFMSQKLE